jgi:hypothetical protein
MIYGFPARARRMIGLAFPCARSTIAGRCVRAFSRFTRERPVPVSPYGALRRRVLAIDNGNGIEGDTLEHMVPRTVLKAVAPKHATLLARDAFVCVALPGRVNNARGCKRIGGGRGEFMPPHALRGLYARAALYVASISPFATEVVDARAISVDLALEWNDEHPAPAWEAERARAFVEFQGAFVLRDAGDLLWRPALPGDAGIELGLQTFETVPEIENRLGS